MGELEPRVKVIGFKFLRRDTYWDFHVPIYENYWMEGVWHHNSGTTTCALAKAVEFMITTPAPRHDTPFWIIAPTYKQCMGACWDEKLNQMGHLPPHVVEWTRIEWYKPKQNWPFSVPLLPLHGDSGKNWKLCFKSYKEGMQGMSAESIGGFLFVEQFPWGLLTEVMRGTREYTFFGNKLAEFTPIDPHLSAPLQEMEENNKIPKGWAIYRANTECAYEQGHVTAQFWEQWYATLPDSIKDVRTKGFWGGYEGLVYPDFNVFVHCLPDEWELPPNMTHRRAIDWGSGPNNAFVCLWLAKNQVGQIFVYDEYYSTKPVDTIVHLSNIQDKMYWPRNNPNYGVAWADPAAGDRFRIAANLPTYTHGQYEAMNIQAARNDQQEGIEHVQHMLKPDAALALPACMDIRRLINPATDPNQLVPQPRLFVHKKKCPNLVREFRSYQYVKPAGKMSVNNVNPKPIPQDFDNHCMDALRYGLFSEAMLSGLTPSVISRQHQNKAGIQPKKRPYHMKRMT